MNSPLLDWNSHLSTPGVTQTSIERRVWHRFWEVSRHTRGQLQCLFNVFRSLHRRERDQFLDGMMSCIETLVGTTAGVPHTSNDWAYQSLTLFIEGIALRFCGNSSSSFTRWARRTGSSSTKKNRRKCGQPSKGGLGGRRSYRAGTGSPARASLGRDFAQREPSVGARLGSIQSVADRATGAPHEPTTYLLSAGTRQSSGFCPTSLG